MDETDSSSRLPVPQRPTPSLRVADLIAISPWIAWGGIMMLAVFLAFVAVDFRQIGLYFATMILSGIGAAMVARRTGTYAQRIRLEHALRNTAAAGALPTEHLSEPVAALVLTAARLRDEATTADPHAARRVAFEWLQQASTLNTSAREELRAMGLDLDPALAAIEAVVSDARDHDLGRRIRAALRPFEEAAERPEVRAYR